MERFLLCFLLACFGGWILVSDARALEIVWPTPNPAWLERGPLEDFVQPAASGRTESALFGCTRTGATRFHEGIDLKPIRRDSRGEPLDPVFSIMPGRVLYANRTAWHSSYGHYVVIEHTGTTPAVISLYAHLGSIDENISEGVGVEAGQRIGIMGRSAGGYTIPVARAHVHLEIGFWLTEDFQKWYDARNFESPNRHGAFSGFNIIGFDPLDFYNKYRSGEVRDVLGYLRQEPVAYTLRVADSKIPDFVRRYPDLVEGGVPGGGVAGWEIEFSWYGLPKGWRPLRDEDLPGEGGSRVEIVSFDADVVAANTCRSTVQLQGGQPRIGATTDRVLELLFGP